MRTLEILKENTSLTGSFLRGCRPRTINQSMASLMEINYHRLAFTGQMLCEFVIASPVSQTPSGRACYIFSLSDRFSTRYAQQRFRVGATLPSSGVGTQSRAN